MKEVIYDYEEFKAKADLTKPIHHEGFREPLGDKYGIFHRIVFRIHAIDKKSGHIIVFEATHRTTFMEEKDHPKIYNDLAEKFAKPLGSTEGKWMP